MDYPQLKRTNYPDRPERTHTDQAHFRDFRDYHLPLARLQHTHLTWGIARGLEVRGTLEGNTITVEPGVAVDGRGQLLVLTREEERSISNFLDTTLYVTLQFAEGRGADGRLEQVPVVLPQEAAAVESGSAEGQVVLALVETDGNGQVTALKVQDRARRFRRQLLGEQVAALELRRSELQHAGPNAARVGEVVSGTLAAGEHGGLRLTVPGEADEILVAREDGGEFRRVEIRADVEVSGTIEGTLAVGTVGPAQVAAGAVTSVHLAEADGTSGQEPGTGQGVKTGHLQDQAVTSPKIADETIQARNLHPEVRRAIASGGLGANAVVSAVLAEADGTSGQETNTGAGVKTGHLQDGAVTSAKLANEAVTAANLVAGSVGTAALTDAAVTSAKLADNAVNAAKLVDGSVGTNELANAAVTTAKLADNAVNAAKLADGSVGTAALTDAAVTSAKLADNAVNAAKLADGSVGTAALTDAAVTTAKLADNAVNAAKLVDGSVGTNELANAAVTSAKLADNAVNAAKLADGSVGTAELTDAAVTSAKLADNAVNAAKLADGSVGTNELANAAVTTAKLQAHPSDSTQRAVGPTHLQADAVGPTHLQANAVGPAQLADGAVVSAKIADRAVTLSKIAPGVLQDIGIGITVMQTIQHGQTIPIPRGFQKSECVFFVALKFLNMDPDLGRQVLSCNVDSDGKVSTSDPGRVLAMGVALAKKGGW